MKKIVGKLLVNLDSYVISYRCGLVGSLPMKKIYKLPTFQICM